MTDPNGWKPKVQHVELERVEGGWLFRTDYGWWAHPEDVLTDYSWGPYIAHDVAVAALRTRSGYQSPAVRP